MNKKAIGVFDSGVGGLTTLEYLIKALPNENFVYLGDTLNCPYGTKNKELLEEIVEKNIHYLEGLDVKMIVIACNTATANSYHIKSDIPIIRIIEPTANKALSISENIGVLATNYTVNSKAYEKFLFDKMIGVCCSELVTIVEDGKQNTQEAYDIIKPILQPIVGKVDTVILGCTHFGLLKNDILRIMGNINVVNSSEAIVDEVVAVLKEKKYLNNCENPKVVLQCTGEPQNIKIEWFKYQYEGINKVII